MLQLLHFAKSYHDRLIVQAADTTFREGIHWVKGGNGSGKTTLFRSIAGMLPFQGDCWLDETFNLKKHPVDYRLRVNYGEAEPLYPDFLTADELVRWVATTKQAASRQADDLIDVFSMRSFIKTPVGTYSSGMLKKTSLVMAFLGKPRWILLDEPFITLDQTSVAAVVRLIGEGQRSGVNFLLSTHQDVRQTDLTFTNLWQITDQTLRPLVHELPVDRPD